MMNQKRLFAQIEYILKSAWNPIGVDDERALEEEYKAYVGPLMKLILDRRTEFEIADYLSLIVRENMGLQVDIEKQKAVAIALVLLSKKDSK